MFGEPHPLDATNVMTRADTRHTCCAIFRKPNAYRHVPDEAPDRDTLNLRIPV